MEKDAIPIGENPRPVTRSHWKRSLVELNGKPGRNYIRDVSPLLMKSYAEIGAFPHEHRPWQSPCTTYTRQLNSADMLHMLYSGSASDYTDYRLSQSSLAFYFLQSNLLKVGISALAFDTKGTCLASVTRSGCLTVHKFESLYSHNDESGKDEEKMLLHYTSLEGVLGDGGINVVRWNPSNDDEIAYTSRCNREVSILDMYSSSHEPAAVLRRHAMSMFDRHDLCDIAFLNGDTRVFASDTCGLISMWDRRVGDLPQTVLAYGHNGYSTPIGLTSIQLPGDQYVYGASESDFIYIWDLRGGRSSAAFQSGREVYSLPQTSVNLVSMMNNTGPLKAQANTQPKEIQSININPSCTYQLGFHLSDGWSGVLDMHNFQVSHIHFPAPSPWMDGSIPGIFTFPPRKPSWLPKHSIYVVPSTSSVGLHLLDFYPHNSSPCHVDYDDSKSTGKRTVESKQSVFVPLSKRVTACAIHPLNDTIVAGTLEASLLVVSQKHLCKKGDHDGDDDEHS